MFFEVVISVILATFFAFLRSRLGVYLLIGIEMTKAPPRLITEQSLIKYVKCHLILIVLGGVILPIVIQGRKDFDFSDPYVPSIETELISDLDFRYLDFHRCPYLDVWQDSNLHLLAFVPIKNGYKLIIHFPRLCI